MIRFLHLPHLAAAALVSLIAVSMPCAAHFGDSFPPPERSGVSADTLDSLDAGARAYLTQRLGAGGASRVAAGAASLDPTARIVSACIGPLTARRSRDAALAVVDKNLTRLRYVVVPERPGAAVVAVSDYDLNVDAGYSVRRTPSVECMSTAEIARIRRTPASTEPGTMAVLESLRTVRPFHAVCVSPPVSDVEYWCFQDNHGAPFQRIGGWLIQ